MKVYCGHCKFFKEERPVNSSFSLVYCKHPSNFLKDWCGTKRYKEKPFVLNRNLDCKNFILKFWRRKMKRLFLILIIVLCVTGCKCCISEGAQGAGYSGNVENIDVAGARWKITKVVHDDYIYFFCFPGGGFSVVKNTSPELEQWEEK